MFLENPALNGPFPARPVLGQKGGASSRFWAAGGWKTAGKRVEMLLFFGLFQLIQ